MMNVQGHLGLLLSLPPSMVLPEARNKLLGCYITVNNRLGKVEQIDASELIVSDEQGGLYYWREPEINHIATWMPRSGIYTLTSGHKLLLKKLVRRQWKLSFNWSLYWASYDTCPFKLYRGIKSDDVYIDPEGRLWYMDLIIAVRKRGKLELINKVFEREFNKHLLGNTYG